jgi:single-stranded-DNA-specific exonuclease
MLPIVQRSSRHADPGSAAATLRTAGFSPWLARALAIRGVGEADIAQGRYSLLPYRQLLGIDTLAIGLTQAIDRSERITVVADYDCDGATACAIAVSGLGSLGAIIDFVVPNRFIHGYGLTPSVVDLVVERFPDTRWIITVDNGIASVAGVEAANAVNIAVLVTDHHLPGPELPAAHAIVNPNQPGCTFSSKNLAGCGVMYYVLAATRDCLRAQGKLKGDGPNLAQWLDLVALGTVADVVKLDDNNRWLVQQGLLRIRAGLARPGIAALFAVANRDPARATAQDFGFALGPRLNAAGRLDDMSVGIQCLLATDEPTAHEIAMDLDRLNRERKDIEGTMKEIAWAAIDLSGQAGRFTRVVYDETFHEGVIGIVAGRIKEETHTPTVVFARAQEDDLVKGSGRSIPGLHLRDALDLVHKRGNGLFHKFGGHAMAAGVTLKEDRLGEFRELFEAAVRELLEERLPEKILEVDGDLPDDVLNSPEMVRELIEQVWGQGFEEPIWTGNFLLEDARLIGAEKNHLSMTVRRGQQRWKAMRFFTTELPPHAQGDTIHLAYRPSLNEFRGETSIDLMVVDM